MFDIVFNQLIFFEYRADVLSPIAKRSGEI